uniref:Vitronectin n=1 Tax=Pseudonaja textilis TaxID=8673 RepID=A0A670Z033_PSETE
MDLLPLALLLGCFCGTFAAEESCEGRCDKGFDSLKKCQCDDLCLYYQSCCGDYASICKTKVTRGDVFLQPEDDYQDYYDVANATVGPPSTPETTGTPVDEQAWTEDYAWTEGLPGHTEETPWSPTDAPPLPGPEEGEESLCSGEPFDAFTSLKNGSIFAFRGLYLYELDEKSARPGYPKLIRDVWGIDGPIDAAFTRVNCQGKTYLFQGSRYWRFDEGRLDADYPRNISEGFEGVPDDLDAALALPAENYLGRERVYFFKGARGGGGGGAGGGGGLPRGRAALLTRPGLSGPQGAGTGPTTSPTSPAAPSASRRAPRWSSTTTRCCSTTAGRRPSACSSGPPGQTSTTGSTCTRGGWTGPTPGTPAPSPNTGWAAPRRTCCESGGPGASGPADRTNKASLPPRQSVRLCLLGRGGGAGAPS